MWPNHRPPQFSHHRFSVLHQKTFWDEGLLATPPFSPDPLPCNGVTSRSLPGGLDQLVSFTDSRCLASLLDLQLCLLFVARWLDTPCARVWHWVTGFLAVNPGSGQAALSGVHASWPAADILTPFRRSEWRAVFAVCVHDSMMTEWIQLVMQRKVMFQ